jgi:hypothetical protein
MAAFFPERGHPWFECAWGEYGVRWYSGVLLRGAVWGAKLDWFGNGTKR